MKLDSKILIGAIAVAGIALAAVSGLEGGPGADPAAGPGDAGLPEGHPAVPDGMTAPVQDVRLSGTVREVVAAAGYTYARLDTDQGEVWAAGPVADLTEGERVGLSGVMDMGAFQSPALDRSFDRLLFTNRFVREGETAGAFTGTVVQAVSASRYVYVQVRTTEGTEWLAAPATELSEGDEVRWERGSVMRDFASTTLDRTFDEILFVGRLEVVEGS